MRLAIVILNYRTPQLVVDCLASLDGQVEVGTDLVVVVDNASGDGSVETIQEAIATHQWESWVQLVPSPINGGFSAGNNVGMKAADAEAYLLLNSDTIVRPGAIASLLKAMATHPEAGLISPRLEWPDATPQISCFRYHSPVSEIIDAAATGPVTRVLRHYDVPIPVSDVPFEPQWTSFACVLIRQDVIRQVGLMDEGYFMYFDDVDYCRKARQKGWRILHWPEARVVHLRGGSGTVKSEIAARKRPRPYLYASRTRYFRTFYGPLGLWLANVGWLLGRSIALLREWVGHKKPHTCEGESQDIWMNWRSPMKPWPVPGQDVNTTRG
jgi:GT2 family glycosyltransferase